MSGTVVCQLPCLAPRVGWPLQPSLAELELEPRVSKLHPLGGHSDSLGYIWSYWILACRMAGTPEHFNIKAVGRGGGDSDPLNHGLYNM